MEQQMPKRKLNVKAIIAEDSNITSSTNVYDKK